MLWTHGAAQAAAAKKSVAKIQKARSRKPTTEVRAAGTFWIAEDYHQKYYLRGRKGLAQKLLGAKVTDDALRESTLAARVNGWLTGKGTPAEIEKQVTAFKLSPEARKALHAALGKRVPALCK